MDYYIQGDAAKAGKIKAAFERLGIDVLDFGFADKTVVYCSIGGCGGCVQYLPYSINLMHILYSHPDYQELQLQVQPRFKVGDKVVYKGKVCAITFMDEVYYDFDGGVAGCRIELQDGLLSPAPKFEVGDWVAGIDDEGDMATEKIVSLSHNKVLLLDTDGCHTEYPKTELSNFHLWTIADAKDGDVLVSGTDNPFIYNGNIEFSSAGAYVGVSRNGRIRLDMFPSKAWTSIKGVKPSTKEQRDLLFAKIREAGHEWDADKKELRRRTIEPTFKVGDEIFSRHARNEYFKIKGIEKDNDTVWYVTTRTRIADNDKRIGEIVRINAFYQNGYSIAPKSHYGIANFHEGMPVLVRDGDCHEWRYVTFSHYRKVGTPFCAGGQYWYQCIPFSEETKHLLGTTDMCPEEFINW